MLLHIGENRFVPTADVIAIQPADRATAETERIVRDCAEIGRYYPSYGRPKAYVICSRDGATFVYAAATAVETLKERLQNSLS
ncbi:MAG: DUF370 domain-containing protein [Clostridia bacterium]|nr:DUF370 domain-containing protein [Clostridia bacterium]